MDKVQQIQANRMLCLNKLGCHATYYESRNRGITTLHNPALLLFALNIYFVVQQGLNNSQAFHQSHTRQGRSWWPARAGMPPPSPEADRLVPTPPTWTSHRGSQTEGNHTEEHYTPIFVCLLNVYLVRFQYGVSSSGSWHTWPSMTVQAPGTLSWPRIQLWMASAGWARSTWGTKRHVSQHADGSHSVSDHVTSISENEKEAKQLAATIWGTRGKAMLETKPLH